MELPNDHSKPFFAYGLFKPGELAWFRLREFVSIPPLRMSIPGRILLRDGVPIIDLTKRQGNFDGCLLRFMPERASEAYQRIADMEPKKLYKWCQIKIGDESVNILDGRSANKGSAGLDDEWSSWNDPMFTSALEVVEETLQTPGFEGDPKAFFRIHMAYLLLWTSIERYVTLRHYFGDRSVKRVAFLAKEAAFVAGLETHSGPNGDHRDIFSSDEPGDRVKFDRQSPKKAVDYYYQVRSNLAHRGKAIRHDYVLLKLCTEELLNIFRDVLTAAELEAKEEYPSIL